MSDTRRESARQWLLDYDKPLRIRDGEHLADIANALEAYARHYTAAVLEDVAQNFAKQPEQYWNVANVTDQLRARATQERER